MASLRQCDVCGALSDPERPDQCPGVLYVVKALRERTMGPFMVRQDAFDTYDLCEACARTFVALIRQQQRA